MQMPVFVIERFEVVHVQHEDRERALGELEFLFEFMKRGNEVIFNIAVGESVRRCAAQHFHGHDLGCPSRIFIASLS